MERNKILAIGLFVSTVALSGLMYAKAQNAGSDALSLGAGDLEVVSVSEAEASSPTFLVGFHAAGNPLRDVAVYIELMQSGSIASEAVYEHQSIFQGMGSTFSLTVPPSFPPGTYLLAAVVLNADGSPHASFGNLATVMLPPPSNLSPGLPNTGASPLELTFAKMQ